HCSARGRTGANCGAAVVARIVGDNVGRGRVSCVGAGVMPRRFQRNTTARGAVLVSRWEERRKVCPLRNPKAQDLFTDRDAGLGGPLFYFLSGFLILQILDWARTRERPDPSRRQRHDTVFHGLIRQHMVWRTCRAMPASTIRATPMQNTAS